jgi:hypothetical protein
VFSNSEGSGDVTKNRPPAGSKPIDQTDWSGDHRVIKDAIGATPSDDVIISPSGDVWAQNPDGTWTNHGPAQITRGLVSPQDGKAKIVTSDGNEIVPEGTRPASERFSLRIVIRHPSIDPNTISKELEFEPLRRWQAGEPRETPKKRPLEGVWPDTRWIYVVNHREGADFGGEIEKLADNLLSKLPFLEMIHNSGGDITLSVSLPGDVNQESAISWSVLSKLAKLRINLGAEVFPDMK